MSTKELLKGLSLNALIDRRRYTNRLTYDDLLLAESEIGRTLFGPVPEGHQREFFKHKGNSWYWHESWTDQFGAVQGMTIRYDVRPTGVYKKPVGGKYEKLAGEELENFVTAAKQYYALVKEKLYS